MKQGVCVCVSVCVCVRVVGGLGLTQSIDVKD